MPVARLSRAFYEKFGDQITDELVNCLNAIETSYRSELRDLFDAHFGRFEAKLEQRLAETRNDLTVRFDRDIAGLREEIARLDHRIDELRTEMHREIGSVRGDVAALSETLRGEIGSLRGEVGSLRGELRTEFLKWNLAFWAPVMLAIIGLYFRS
ncbi:MAG: hypothetical protein HY560_11225 [Gemmatimonadetes bacterium]|nr:hypothetical protein [Gemmatimonadota bacterium]